MPATRKQLILLGLVLMISTAALLAGDKKSKSKAAEMPPLPLRRR